MNDVNLHQINIITMQYIGVDVSQDVSSNWRKAASVAGVTRGEWYEGRRSAQPIPVSAFKGSRRGLFHMCWGKTGSYSYC